MAITWAAAVIGVGVAAIISMILSRPSFAVSSKLMERHFCQFASRRYQPVGTGCFRPKAVIDCLPKRARFKSAPAKGWLYLSVVMDLFSRQVVGWSMKSRMTTDLASDTLLAAVWRRKPKGFVVVHSDQGSQFSSGDWQSFLKANQLVGSMSRRGNCHDNIVAESLSQLLKRERNNRQIYPTREAARRDLFNYIEMFYNPKRRHGTSDNLSPIEYERRYFQSLTDI